MNESPVGTIEALLPDRPRLRGRLHLLAFVASVLGLVWLVRVADTTRAQVAAWVYGVAACLLYLSSASYHVFARTARTRRVLQRVDHSMIYVLIAATFTPMCLLVLEGALRWVPLVLMWAGAIGGVIIKVIAFERLRVVGGALYIVLGWGALFALPTLVHRPGLLALIVLAGTLYTVGAIFFALGWPQLSPQWFGYHEVWHVFVVAAGAVLFGVNLHLISVG